jgi:hypothetical protein
MAGFVDRTGEGRRSSSASFFGDMIKKLSSVGMKYDDMVIKNSKTIGSAEDKFGWKQDPNGVNGGDMDDYGLFASLAMNDITLRKNISFFDKSYASRRGELINYAKQDEIEEILDTLCDECIVQDDLNFFCEPLPFDDDTMDSALVDKIRESIDDNFRKIYQAWGFANETTAWNFFRKFLVEGFLAFEIIYNTEETHIIGFKSVDSVTLTPALKDGKKVWYQFKDVPQKERKIYDANLIYMSYSAADVPGRISYVERLVRSFNLLRLMEHSRIVYAVVNSSFKTKFTIPVGGKSRNRQKQSLASLMQQYREVIDFSTDSGELKVNGKPMLPFNKEYWFPETDSGTPQMETIGNDGPDLSDTETLKYFRTKLIRVSKIPASRFDSDNQATWSIDAEGQGRDEVKFSRFVNRLRSIFQEIMVKPLWLQMCLEYPDLAEDDNFKSKIGIRFNKMNFFEELKDLDIMQKRLEFIQTAKDSLVDTDADMNEVKYFSSEFLIRRFLKLSNEDIRLNRKFKELEKKKMDGETVSDDEFDV